MTSEHKQDGETNEGDDGSGETDDKPTIIPQFDPEAFAREFTEVPSHGSPPAPERDSDVDINENPTVPPPSEYRSSLATLTDEVELESARRLSATQTAHTALTSVPPPPGDMLPDSMRSSLLSLANARAPSIVPPKPAVEPWTTMDNTMDKGWEELTLDDPLPGEGAGDNVGKSAAEALLSRQTSASPSASIQERTIFKVAAATKKMAPSGEFTVWAPGKTAAAAAAIARHEDHAPAPEPPESSSNPIARVDPVSAHPSDEPEHTVFAPARAKAALTAAPPPPTPGVPAAPAPAAPAAGGTEETLREMRDRFSLGDYTGALVLAEGLLEDLPSAGESVAEVMECAENCRAVLRQMYTARIGPLDRVPVVSVARDQLRWLSIDHRAGFVLSHIDGISSLEMILDVSGMPLLDALRILCELAQQRIISFR